MTPQAKHQQKRSSSSRSKSRKNTLVPFKTDVYTDSMHLTRVFPQVYRCVKTQYINSVIQQSAVAFVYGAFSVIAANLCTDFTSLAAVFDQYRITELEVTFVPEGNQSLIASTSGTYTGAVGCLYTVIDYDDSATLTAPSIALAYENCIQTETYEVNRRCFKPRIAVGAYSGSFTSFANQKAQWIDCSSSSVQHYGIKYVVDTGNASSLQSWNYRVRGTMEFKNSR
jgi:hypothetical protein